jgi:heme/copper-type cytochrome/quinol oxidase subunit 1
MTRLGCVIVDMSHKTTTDLLPRVYKLHGNIHQVKLYTVHHDQLYPYQFDVSSIRLVVSITLRTELNVLGFYSTHSSSLDLYNRVITCHGIGMIFLFIMPVIISFIGNWHLPQSYMALDFATPRLNISAYYSLLLSSVLIVLAISREEGVSAG